MVCIRSSIAQSVSLSRLWTIQHVLRHKNFPMKCAIIRRCICRVVARKYLSICNTCVSYRIVINVVTDWYFFFIVEYRGYKHTKQAEDSSTTCNQSSFTNIVVLRHALHVFFSTCIHICVRAWLYSIAFVSFFFFRGYCFTDWLHFYRLIEYSSVCIFLGKCFCLVLFRNNLRVYLFFFTWGFIAILFLFELTAV